MDPYFRHRFLPMMQIVRGRPFSCSFCNSSVKSNGKICRHSLRNLKADLLYVASYCISWVCAAAVSLRTELAENAIVENPF
jgi:hypothetical protein